MNIFILDQDKSLNAQYHCDKHVVKMILEQTQLLCSAHHICGFLGQIPYRLTHKNHPCAIWTRKSLSNYIWLCDFTLQLCYEYTHRYKKIHKCQKIITDWCMENMPDVSDIGLTPFAQAMPENYCCDNVVLAYRTYYNNEKRHIFKWTNRVIPWWITK